MNDTMAMVFLGIFILVLFAYMRTSRANGNTARMSEDETRMIQDLTLSLEKMEKRIENLETIVIDRARKSEFEKL